MNIKHYMFLLPFFCAQLYSSVIFIPITLADEIKTSNNKILLEHAYYFAARFLLKADYPVGEIAENLEKSILNPAFEETLKSGKTITVAAQLQTAFIDSIAKRRLPKALSDAFITKRLFNDLELKTIYSRFTDEWVPSGQFFVLDSSDGSLEKTVVTALKSKKRSACLFNTGETSAPRWVTLGIAFDGDDVHVYIMDPDKAGESFTELQQDRFTALLSSHDIITLVETSKRRGSLDSDTSDGSGTLEKDADDGASTATDSAGSGEASDSGTSSGRVSTGSVPTGSPGGAGAASGGGAGKVPKRSLWQRIFGDDKKRKKLGESLAQAFDDRALSRQRELFDQAVARESMLAEHNDRYHNLAAHALVAADQFVASLRAPGRAVGVAAYSDVVRDFLSPIDGTWDAGLQAAVVVHEGTVDPRDGWKSASSVAKILALLAADPLLSEKIMPCITVQHLVCSECRGESFIEGHEGFDVPLRLDGLATDAATDILVLLRREQTVTTWCENCRESSKEKLPVKRTKTQRTQVFWGASTPCAVLRIERIVPDGTINQHKITFPADGQCSVYGLKMQIKSVLCLAGERVDASRMCVVTQAQVIQADGTITANADAFSALMTTGQHDGAVGYLYVCEPVPIVVPPLLRTASTRGLKNNGNTCYQSSMLQAMFACEPLRRSLSGYLTGAAGRLAPNLRQTFTELGTAVASPFNPISLNNEIWNLGFPVRAQEDAHEAYIKVTDELKKQRVIPSEYSRTGVLLTSAVDNLMKATVISCQKCHGVRIVTPEKTSYLDLTLGGTSAETINDLVKKIFIKEVINKAIDAEGKEYDVRVECVYCKVKTEHTKTTALSWSDELGFVILQIGRFKGRYDTKANEYIPEKINTPVIFPESGVFYIGGKPFRVVSVVVQSGSLKGGHYFAVTPHAVLNDSTVTEGTGAFRELMTTGQHGGAEGYLYFCVPL